MGKYKGLNVFLEEVLKELGYEFLIINGNNSLFTSTIVRSYEKNFVLNWKIENNLFYSEEITDATSEKLKTALFNRIFFQDKSNITSESLQAFLLDKIRQESPEVRILSVLKFLYQQTPFAGDRINISFGPYKFTEEYWRSMYFHKQSEFVFYLLTAEKLGYIEMQARTANGYTGIQLTANGLKSIINIEKQEKAKTCFVAMSFDAEMFQIYDTAIKPAIYESGFEPLIISEKKDIPSDTTINDAILAAIKKSKFTIADFTNHKHGVYFESGYALGRGQKVIYTCRADEIGKAHFDTRNYQHIVWKDANDLKQQLVDKIEVFIKG